MSEKFYFYYGRDNQNSPLVTVCLYKKDDKVTRGVAICSEKDLPNKKKGKSIAKDRAIKAMINHCSSNTVISRDRAWKQLCKCNLSYLDYRPHSNYFPVFSKFEEDILNKGE